MKPSALWNSLRQSTVVAVFNCFIAVGYGAARLAGFEGLMPLIGAALIFSSTIIGIKLPHNGATSRHWRTDDRTAVVSGFAAIIVLVVWRAQRGARQSLSADISRPLLALPLLLMTGQKRASRFPLR